MNYRDVHVLYVNMYPYNVLLLLVSVERRIMMSGELSRVCRTTPYNKP